MKKSELRQIIREELLKETSKNNVADSWYTFTRWLPEINPKFIKTFDVMSIEIMTSDGTRFYYKK